MIRATLSLLFALVSGCCLPEREALRPLTDDPRLYSYLEVHRRAKAQTAAAVEAFYGDQWSDLEETAKSLEQSARYLPKTVEVPVALKDKVHAEADQFRRDSQKLAEAALAKDVRAVTESLQRIHRAIRELRPPE